MTQNITSLKVKDFEGVKQITIEPDGKALIVLAGGGYAWRRIRREEEG